MNRRYEPVIYDSAGDADGPTFGVDIGGNTVWFGAEQLQVLILLCDEVDADGTAAVLAAPLRSHLDDPRLHEITEDTEFMLLLARLAW